MIPKAMEQRIREGLIRNHIGEEHPGFKFMMGLIETEATPERQWVYPREGQPCIVSISEAKALLATDEYADHPDGFIVESDEDNKVTRSWEKQKEVAPKSEEIEYTAENGDAVFVRDQDGKAVGGVKYLKPLTSKDLKDEVIARAIGVGIDPPDTNKGNILALIERKRVSEEGEPITSDPLVTVASSTEELVAAADDLGLIIPEDTPKEEAVKLINTENAKKPEE